MRNFADFLRVALAPIIIIVLLGGLIALWYALDLPQGGEFLAVARDYYARYGYWVVFLAALVEGTLVVNWYFPGSLVITLGVIFAKEGGLNPVLVVGLIILAFFLTTLLNYAMGRYGWYRVLLAFGLTEPLKKMRSRVERTGPAIVFATYFHPNIGALTATCAGILHISFRRFVAYSAAALVVWNTFWGTVVYLIGPVILQFVRTWILGVVALAWFGWLLIDFAKKKRATAP